MIVVIKPLEDENTILTVSRSSRQNCVVCVLVGYDPLLIDSAGLRLNSIGDGLMSASRGAW